jgi:hypothetical protein
MREAQQIKQLEATGSHNPLTLELLPRAQNPQKKTKRKDQLDSRDGDEDGVIPSFRELEAEVEALCDGKLSEEVVVCPKRRRSLKSQF